MSNVFLRKRADTELTFMTTARQLQNELTKYVMREKVMPKKWRYMIGRTLIAKVDEMVDNIIAANFRARRSKITLPQCSIPRHGL